VSSDRRFHLLLAAVGAFILLQAGFDLYAGWRGIDAGIPVGRMRLITLAWSRVPSLVAADICLVVAALGLGAGTALRRLAAAHLGLGVLAALAVPLFFRAGGEVALTVGVGGLAAFRIQFLRVLLGLLALAAGAVVAGGALRDRRLLQSGT